MAIGTVPRPAMYKSHNVKNRLKYFIQPLFYTSDGSRFADLREITRAAEKLTERLSAMFSEKEELLSKRSLGKSIGRC
jgi:hypothetical protein